jgi:hypothetical protein
MTLAELFNEEYASPKRKYKIKKPVILTPKGPTQPKQLDRTKPGKDKPVAPSKPAKPVKPVG